MSVRLNSKQRFLVILISVLNVYAIIEGAVYKSGLGIALACISLCTLAVCLHIFRKLQELKDAEENGL